jgi:hypothetical protein
MPTKEESNSVRHEVSRTCGCYWGMFVQFQNSSAQQVVGVRGLFPRACDEEGYHGKGCVGQRGVQFLDPDCEHRCTIRTIHCNEHSISRNLHEQGILVNLTSTGVILGATGVHHEHFVRVFFLQRTPTQTRGTAAACQVHWSRSNPPHVKPCYVHTCMSGRVPEEGCWCPIGVHMQKI